jgi:putative S-methylcysteine transport system substrate-binding protein
MKKILVLMISLLLLILAACGNNNNNQGKEESNATSNEQKVIKVGATGQSYPNAYQENGKLVGFDVEVIETVAKNLGYTIEWTLSDFSGLMGQLEAKKIDTVANAVGVTPEREEKYNFTEPYAYAGAQIVTHKDNTDINSLEDLKGKTVSGVLGSNNVKNLQKYDKKGEIKIRTYETRDGAMNDAINKRVDGYINARSTLLAEIEKRDLPFKFVGDPVAYESVAFPFAKNDAGTQFQKAFNDEIKKLREDGTLTKISEKYFKEDITVKSNEQ